MQITQARAAQPLKIIVAIVTDIGEPAWLEPKHEQVRA